ncbi:Rv1733c family protein [Streptomyces sp. CA-249302]|uniref:Rv1733c family protein n=1 Tax=Streptomyces sp. CA-249302 TaxID=3240058 RepID=UPI003D8B626E
MRKVGRTRVVGWRWRSNELRRRSDVVEAWIVLGAWTLATGGAVAAGIVGAQAAQHAVDEDRAGRRPVSAVLVKTVPGSGRDVVTGIRYDRVRATVRWTEPGGGKPVVHMGTTEVKPTAEPGSTVRVWTDGRGRLVAAPASPAEAATRVVLAGSGVALAAGLTVLGGGSLVRLRVQRRATEEWGVEWERVGREWGHTTG